MNCDIWLVIDSGMGCEDVEELIKNIRQQTVVCRLCVSTSAANEAVIAWLDRTDIIVFVQPDAAGMTEQFYNICMTLSAFKSTPTYVTLMRSGDVQVPTRVECALTAMSTRAGTSGVICRAATGVSAGSTITDITTGTFTFAALSRILCNSEFDYTSVVAADVLYEMLVCSDSTFLVQDCLLTRTPVRRVSKKDTAGAGTGGQAGPRAKLPMSPVTMTHMLASMVNLPMSMPLCSYADAGDAISICEGPDI